jgi:hypothetical protein
MGYALALGAGLKAEHPTKKKLTSTPDEKALARTLIGLLDTHTNAYIMIPLGKFF